MSLWEVSLSRFFPFSVMGCCMISLHLVPMNPGNQLVGDSKIAIWSWGWWDELYLWNPVEGCLLKQDTDILVKILMYTLYIYVYTFIYICIWYMHDMYLYIIFVIRFIRHAWCRYRYIYIDISLLKVSSKKKWQLQICPLSRSFSVNCSSWFAGSFWRHVSWFWGMKADVTMSSGGPGNSSW